MADILQELISKLSLDADDFTTGIDTVSGKLESFGAAATTIGTNLSLYVTAPLAGLAAASLASYTNLDTLKRGLVAITGSTTEANTQFARLVELAKLPGLGLEEVTRGSIALQAAGLSAQQAESAIAAFGNALASVGRGREELDRVIVQLQQMASKPAIEQQDLKIIMEQVPQAATLIKNEFGEISSKAINAKTDAAGFITFLITELAKLPPVTTGVKNDIENFRDTTTQALSKIGESLAPVVSKIVNELGPALTDASKWFSDLDPGWQSAILGSAGFAAALGPLVLVLGQTATALAAAPAAIATLGAAMAPIAITATAIGVAIGTWKIKDWINDMSQAAGQLLGGWVPTLDKTNAEFVKLKDSTEALSNLVQSKLPTYDDYAKKLIDTANAKADASAKSADLKAKLEAQKKAQEDAKEAARLEKEELDKLSASMANDWANIAHDITERNKWKQALIDENAELKKQNEELDAFVAAAIAAKPEYTGLANFNTSILTPSLVDVNEELNGIPRSLQLSTLEMSMLKSAAETAIDGEGGIKGRFKGFSTEVSTVVTNMVQGISDSLWDGKLSWKEKGLAALTDLGKAATSMFIQPFTEAIATFISGALTDLLSGRGLGGVLDRLGAIGDAVGGIFGGGASAASGAAGAAGSAGSAAGSAGSAAGAASGVMGAITAIGSIGSMISGIIGNFQTANTNEKLTLIEENTRYVKIWTGEGTDSLLGHLQSLDGLVSQIWTGLVRIEQEAFMLFSINDGIYEIRDDLRLKLYPQMEKMADRATSVVFNITGGDPEKIADTVMLRMREQMA